MANSYLTTLVIPSRKPQEISINQSIYDFYDINNRFPIIRTFWLRKIGSLFLGLHGALLCLLTKQDIVLTRSLESAFLCTLIGIDTIYETHTPIVQKRRIQIWMFKKIYKHRNLKKIVVISEALKNIVLDHFNEIEYSKIIVAHDGADIKNDAHKSTKSIKDIGYIGHLYNGRGIDIILDVAKKLTKLRFHVVGGNPKDVEYWKEKTKNFNNITFYGFVSPKDAAEIRDKMDILLAPYQKSVMVDSGMDTSKWMSPLKIFEYMASKKAIIASDIPVLREVLTHEKNALLCTPDNPIDWITSIERLINDNDLYSYISENALEDLVEKYSWKSRAKKIIEESLHGI